MLRIELKSINLQAFWHAGGPYFETCNQHSCFRSWQESTKMRWSIFKNARKCLWCIPSSSIKQWNHYKHFFGLLKNLTAIFNKLKAADSRCHVNTADSNQTSTRGNRKKGYENYKGPKIAPFSSSAKLLCCLMILSSVVNVSVVTYAEISKERETWDIIRYDV